MWTSPWTGLCSIPEGTSRGNIAPGMFPDLSFAQAPGRELVVAQVVVRVEHGLTPTDRQCIRVRGECVRRIASAGGCRLTVNFWPQAYSAGNTSGRHKSVKGAC